MTKKYQRVVVLGSLAFDHIMVLPGTFSDWIMPDKIHSLNVSFTVESLRKEFGGTGGNCAYTLGLLGMNPKLLAVMGKDGNDYLQHLANAGVDVSGITLDDELLMATGNVMTDRDNNQLWSFYPGPLAQMKDISLKSIAHTDDFIALLPSEPASFVKHMHEAVELGAHFMFDPAFFIPNIATADLRLGLQYATVIIGNDYEIALMEHKTKSKLSEWVKKKNTVVIRTLGAQGSEIFHQKKAIRIPAAEVESTADPTGAGDAYRAGFLAGFTEGKDLMTCGEMAATAAAYTVELYGTQTHAFTRKKFYQRLKKGPELLKVE